MNWKLQYSGEKLDSMSDQEVIRGLTKQNGIGTWTAKMYLVFVLDRQNVLPCEDIAFLQGCKWAYKTDDISKQSVEKRCRKWRPFSSIAARFFKALDMELTKEELHLYK